MESKNPIGFVGLGSTTAQNTATASIYNKGDKERPEKQRGWRLRRSAKRNAKRTAAGIPTWSPTVVLICRSTAYVWQSGRDAQFSADYGRT
jgi:hypothetical protein